MTRATERGLQFLELISHGPLAPIIVTLDIVVASLFHDARD